MLAAELDALGKELADPRRPLVAIVGGAKVSTKLTVLRALAAKVDLLIVDQAMPEMSGWEVVELFHAPNQGGSSTFALLKKPKGHAV